MGLERHPPSTRSTGAVLDALTTSLVQKPDASLSELAAQIGIGRTTLHRLFATREEVVRAVALHAIEQLSAIYADTLEREPPVPGAPESFRALIAQLIPRGPSLMFLLRSRELDSDDVTAAVRQLDAGLHRAISAAQGRGELNSHQPASWIAETFYAIVYIAWEQIASGDLAPRHAPDLVMETWLSGVASRR